MSLGIPRRIAAGATEIQAVDDGFQGDRFGSSRTRGATSGPSPPVEDVPEDEMGRRMAEMQQG